MTMTNIIAGFRTTGIYPFNRHALLPAPPTPSKFNLSVLCQGTKLKVHPPYSPAKRRSCSLPLLHAAHPLSLRRRSLASKQTC